MSAFSGIEAFIHTAEQRSFRAAAAQLEVTPAAVSKAVAKLEARLGVRLLDRTSRTVALTREGAAYLPHCRRALDALHAGRDAVAAAHQVVAGTLTVSTSPVLASRITAGLPVLLARHPGLSLDLRLTDVSARLIEDDIDVAVRIGALEDSRLTARRLRATTMVTVAAPSLIAGKALRTPEDLAALPCLKYRSPGGVVVEWVFAASRGRAGEVVALPTAHRLSQGDRLVEAALAGVGVAQVFDFLVTDALAAGRLTEVLPRRAAAGPPIHALCRPGQSRTPRIRAFFEFLSGVIGR